MPDWRNQGGNANGQERGHQLRRGVIVQKLGQLEVSVKQPLLETQPRHRL